MSIMMTCCERNCVMSDENFNKRKGCPKRKTDNPKKEFKKEPVLENRMVQRAAGSIAGGAAVGTAVGVISDCATGGVLTGVAVAGAIWKLTENPNLGTEWAMKVRGWFGK